MPPLAFTLALPLGLAAVLILLRKKRLPFLSRLLFAAGICLLVYAADEPIVWRSAPGSLAVMVDLSPSTRGAAYRDPTFLNRRLAALLGNTPYNLLTFSDGTFTPPPADALLLFSGGHFTPPPASPPIYPVLDPLLENSTDAAITDLHLNGNQLTVSVTNNGPPRQLTLHGVLGPATQSVAGDQTFLAGVDPKATRIWAELSPGDLWPENDSASIRPIPPINNQRWWIGDSPPPLWQALSQLPGESAAYLSPQIIVLNNVAATALSGAQQARLSQYVRDLGGSVLILGGDHAFGAGGYDGSILGSLSPLSSSPPRPATNWILLADASGSMAAPESAGATRWDYVAAAIVKLLPFLPPSDLVRVGQFSDSLRWWSDGLPAAQTAKLPLPPPNALPHGPTNLEPVLQALAAKPGGGDTQLILLTDADVQIDDPAGLAAAFNAAGIHLNLLAIENGSGLPQLEQIVTASAGSVLTQKNPDQWTASARQLLSAALPDRFSHEPIRVRFIGPAQTIPGGEIPAWNRTWLRPNATQLADSDQGPLAALWHYGAGRVAAVAFSAVAQANALADLIAQPPRDPRLKVSWQTGLNLRVAVNAVDNGQYLNGLNLTLELRVENSSTMTRKTIPQIAPGEYELSLLSPEQPSIATVRQNDLLVDRIPLAGWYSSEFSSVGEDRQALNSLADRSRGQIIPPNQTTPIDFAWPRQPFPLMPWLAGGGALLIAVGLLLQRKYERQDTKTPR